MIGTTLICLKNGGRVYNNLKKKVIRDGVPRG
jgi:hypothetical protein